MFLLKHTLDLPAAVIADASSLKFILEKLLTRIAISTCCPYVTCESLAQVAAVVEVL